jgi:hypothetical protein
MIIMKPSPITGHYDENNLGSIAIIDMKPTPINDGLLTYLLT